MKRIRKLSFIFAFVMCLGMGITVFASNAACTLRVNGTLMGNGNLKRYDSYGRAYSELDRTYQSGRRVYAYIVALNKSGKAYDNSTDSGIGSLQAFAYSYYKNPYKYRGIHKIQNSSTGAALTSVTIYAFR